MLRLFSLPLECVTSVSPSVAAWPPLTYAFISLQTSSTGKAWPREGGFTASDSGTDVPHSSFPYDRSSSNPGFRFLPRVSEPFIWFLAVLEVES